jgi:hypothetical protein
MSLPLAGDVGRWLDAGLVMPRAAGIYPIHPIRLLLFCWTCFEYTELQ